MWRYVRFVFLFLQGRSSLLKGPCTTEEALSLIKEEEVLHCCNYVVPLKSECYRPCSIFHVPVKGKRNKWTTQPLTLTWLFKACGDLSKVWALRNDDQSLTRAADHNEFLYLNLELGRFAGGLINFPWTMQALIFFFAFRIQTRPSSSVVLKMGRRKNSLGFPSPPSAVVELQQVKCHSEISVLLVEQWTPHQLLPFL